ncbi:ABC transporter permease [Thermaerobacillus caldiproteolyticus]|uniref:NitT/TauT family transport system permease protein n=1 Tax=Thermaerobacillus caldiproteolyticus TaxID=247480 RepID=A0A7W0BZ97_9BACL|nr:ABC transporter permease [Anoxybacillus caldiproteolyticus]MBA2873894.1 NitT/TauT family transport system permease protein [Anoxybacillus caldiproteolyticus]QPA30441.1 ABC transporter permease [Anoxybacillus caldiproteolyticus]
MKQTNNQIQVLHEQYVIRLKQEKRWVRFFQLLIFVAFFSLWEIASRNHWIDPLLFSSPSTIWKLFVQKIADGSLVSHTGITLGETIIGFMLATFAGTFFAALLWWFPRLSKIVDPYLVILNAMPKVALGPIFIVALGPGFTSIIAMGTIISLIITTIVVYTSFKEVDPNYIKVLKTFGASRFQCFKEAVLPSSFPTIISTLKVNVGLSWVGVVVGEFLVSKQGLGYMIIYGFQVFNFTLVLLSLLVIAFLATIMYQIVGWIERKLIKNR